jgi:hypothetical protein
MELQSFPACTSYGDGVAPVSKQPTGEQLFTPSGTDGGTCQMPDTTGDKSHVTTDKKLPFKATGGMPALDPAKLASQKAFVGAMNAAGFGKDVHPGGFIKKGSDTEKMLLKGTGYKSVQDMQKAMGVKPDGIIGPATLKALAQKTGGTSFFKPATDEVDVPKFFTAVSEKAMQQGFEDAGFQPVGGDASQWPTFAAAASKEAGKKP